MKLVDIVKENEVENKKEEIKEVLPEVKEGDGEVKEANMEIHDSENKVIETNSEEVEKINKELFEKIKNIALTQGMIESKEKYFSKKGKITIVMNKFELRPSTRCLLNRKNFKEVYLQELESILFNEKVEENKLIALMYLHSRLNKGFYPIGVKYNNFTSLENDIIFVLNKFFNKHKHLMNGMFNMMKPNIEQGEKSNADVSEASENN